MQVRSSEKARLGIFGGGIENNETPIEADIRELKEETGIEACEEQLDFLEINEHDLEYENGDKVHYVASLYLLKLSEYPTIKLDSESNGILTISKENYRDYTDIQNINSLQLHKYWQNTISNVKSYASRKAYDNKIVEDEAELAYKREYQRRITQVYRADKDNKLIIKVEFLAWKENAREQLKLYRENKITKEEFCEWIEKNNNYEKL